VTPWSPGYKKYQALFNEKTALRSQYWLELSTHFEDRFKCLVGSGYSPRKLIGDFG